MKFQTTLTDVDWRMSPPSRGAWIEIQCGGPYSATLRVAPLAGGVGGYFGAATGSDPNRDPNAEATGEFWVDTVDVPLSRKCAKGVESVG